MNPCVYIHVDGEGTILYVGMSLYLEARLREHGYSSHWFKKISRVEILHFDSKEDAAREEAHLIYALKPLYNRVNRRKNKFSFSHLRPAVAADFLKAVL